MKAIVFGGTGFIGSHVVEQLHFAGHDVTAAVRETSSTAFLESLGVRIVRVDFSNSNAVGEIIQGHEVVYNCTADAKLHSKITLEAEVEIKLTRRLIEAAALNGASRFIQLSTIVIYDFQTNDPIDETYLTQSEYPVQILGLEREKVIKEAGEKTGISTVILRPASTIGIRDRASFFSRLFAAHTNDKFPLLNNGSAKVSLIDTRDIGRAMAWLGMYHKPENDDGTYLLKGFDTSWHELKSEIDHAAGRISKTIDLPGNLTDEELTHYNLTPYAVKTFTVNRLWNDRKIRKLGFSTNYSLRDAVETAVRDLVERKEL